MNYTLVINGHKYEVNERWKDFAMKVAHKSMIKEHKHFIYALEDGDVVALVRIIFESKDRLLNTIEKLEETGFIVHYKI